MNKIKELSLLTLGMVALVLLISVPVDTLPLGWWCVVMIASKVGAVAIFLLIGRLYRVWQGETLD